MHKLTLVAPAALLIAGSAQAMVVDLSGEEANGAFPNILNVNNVDTGAIASLSWDLTYSAFSPSWGSEVEIALVHPGSGFTYIFDGSDDNFADILPADTTFGWGNSSGVFTSAGSVDVTGVADVSGLWFITIFEEYDDKGPAADGEFLSGSFIQINTVPAPGVLALLGLAGLVGGRWGRHG